MLITVFERKRISVLENRFKPVVGFTGLHFVFQVQLNLVIGLYGFLPAIFDHLVESFSKHSTLNKFMCELILSDIW